MTKATTMLQPGDAPWVFPENAKVGVFDVETNGLLDEATKLHCLVVRDFGTGDVAFNLARPTADEVAEALSGWDYLVAHNGFRFDYPVLTKLTGWAPWADRQNMVVLLDTLPMARLIYSYLDDLDSSLTFLPRILRSIETLPGFREQNLHELPAAHRDMLGRPT